MLSLLAFVLGQNTESCIPGSPITILSNCNYLDSAATSCSGLASAGQFRPCWCNQVLFNAIIG